MAECETELKTMHSMIKDIKRMFSAIAAHEIEFDHTQAYDPNAEYQKELMSTISDKLWRSIGEDTVSDMKDSIIHSLDKTQMALVKHSYEDSFRISILSKKVDQLNDMYK